ncbi:hypothetical protein V8D89_004248 [Ganoderma adspersum]
MYEVHYYMNTWRCNICQPQPQTSLSPSLAVRNEDTASHIYEVCMRDAVEDINPFSFSAPLHNPPNPPTSTPYTGVLIPMIHSESGPSHGDLPAIHGPALSNDPPGQTYDNSPLPVGETRLQEALVHPMSAEEITVLETEGPPQFENVELASIGAQSLVEEGPHYVKAHLGEKDYWPWDDKARCTMSALRGFPHALFWESELEAIRWFAHANSMPMLPSVKMIKHEHKDIMRVAGAAPQTYTSKMGRVYAMATLAVMLAHALTVATGVRKPHRDGLSSDIARDREHNVHCTVCGRDLDREECVFGDMVVEMRAERSDDGGDIAKTEESTLVLWVSGDRIGDGGEAEGDQWGRSRGDQWQSRDDVWRWNEGLEEDEQVWTIARTRWKRDKMGAERKRALSDDRWDREVGVEEAQDKARVMMELRRDDGAWEARRQMFAYGRSDGVSSDTVVDLEGARGSDAGFMRVTATSTVGSLKHMDGAVGLDVGARRTLEASDLRDAGVADRSAGACSSKLSRRKLLLHLRKPLLVVDVRDEVAVSWSQYWRSKEKELKRLRSEARSAVDGGRKEKMREDGGLAKSRGSLRLAQYGTLAVGSKMIDLNTPQSGKSEGAMVHRVCQQGEWEQWEWWCKECGGGVVWCGVADQMKARVKRTRLRTKEKVTSRGGHGRNRASSVIKVEIERKTGIRGAEEATIDNTWSERQNARIRGGGGGTNRNMKKWERMNEAERRERRRRREIGMWRKLDVFFCLSSSRQPCSIYNRILVFYL